MKGLAACSAALAAALVLSIGAMPAPAAKAPACAVVNLSYPTYTYSSLQAALDDAGLFWGDTIVVKGTCTGATVISTPNVSSTEPLTIIGQQAKGFTAPTLDGGGVGPVVSVIGHEAIVAISSLTITGGVAGSSIGGGGVFNEGTLIITGSTIRGNDASIGGGIASLGTLTLTDCTVSGNDATMLGGGVVNVSGTLTLNRTTISGNTAIASGQGGGGIVSMGGAVVLNDSIVSQNTTTGIGGGIVAVAGDTEAASITLNGRSKVNANTAPLGGGVVILGHTNTETVPPTAVAATLTLNGSSRIMNNAAIGSASSIPGYGGGVYVVGDAAMLTLNDSSSITGNTAALGGGGIAVASGTLDGVTSSNVYRNTPDNVLFDAPAPW